MVEKKPGVVTREYDVDACGLSCIDSMYSGLSRCVVLWIVLCIIDALLSCINTHRTRLEMADPTKIQLNNLYRTLQ
jgi:hypothetical protein